jgi:outer membrane protein insertion porin family
VLLVVPTVCALLVLLHLPLVKASAGAGLARLLSRATEAEVSFARLDYRLWAGEATVQGLSLRRPDLDVTSSRVQVRLRPSGVRVEIADPRVIAGPPAAWGSGAPLAPSQPWAGVRRFAGVVVERGAIELRDRDGASWLQADGIDARVDRRGDRSRGTATVARIGVGWPGGGRHVEGARADAEIEIDQSTGVLHLVQGHVVIGGTDVRATGRLDQVGPIRASTKAQGRIDATLLTRVAPALEADGALHVRLSVAHDSAGTNGAIELDTAEFAIAGVGPLSGGLRSRFEGRRLLVDSVDLRGHAAELSASGVVPLGEGASAIEVRARVHDVAALGAAFLPTPPPVASHADLDLRLEIENWRAETLAGAGHVSLHPRPGPGWPISGRSAITVSGKRVRVVTRELRVGEARLSVDGSFIFPTDLSVDYNLRVPDLETLGSLAADADFMAPPLALDGAVDIAGSLTGRLPQWELNARMFTRGFAVEGVELDVETSVSLTRTGLEFESLAAQGPDGYIKANGFVPLDPEREWAVHADVAALQLTDALSRRGMPVHTTIDGRIRIDGPAAPPRARFVVDAQAAPAGCVPPSEVATGARVRLHAAGSVSRQNLVLERATADLAGGRVQASGSWQWSNASLEGRLAAAGVALEALPWLPIGTSGVTSTISAEVSVAGTTRAPSGRASVTLTANTFRERAFPDVTLEATADARQAWLRGLIGARPLLTGNLAFMDAWPLHLDLDLAALPMTEVVRTLPSLSEAEAAIAVGGHASVDVPVLAPRDLRYVARVTHLEARLRRHWRAGAFTVQGDVHALDVGGLTLEADGFALNVEGRVAIEETNSSASLAARGEVPLSDLAWLVPDAELEGRVGMDVRVTGSLRDPAVDGTLAIAAGPGRVGPVRWAEAHLKGGLADGTLTLETARAAAMGGAVSLTGSVPLAPRANGRAHEIRLEATGIELGTLRHHDGVTATDQSASPVSAVVDLSARLSATHLALDAVEGDGRLTRFDVSTGAQVMALEAPVVWQLSGGTFRHSLMSMRGPAVGPLEIAARVESAAPARRFKVGIAGQVDLAAAQPFLSGAARLSGPAQLDLAIEQGPEGLSVTGEARVENGRVVLREPPVAIDGLTGTLRASGRRIELSGVGGAMGDGRLTAAGHVTLPSWEAPEVDLGLQFERVPLHYPEGLRSRASGTVRLVGGAGRYRLEGAAVVHRAVYDRSPDWTARLLDRVEVELAALDTLDSPLQNVELDVRVRLEDGLRIANDLARVVVDGALAIGGDLATPDVRGSLVLREGGTVQLPRATLRIAEGRVELAGFPARGPDLNVQGRTQVSGVLIDMTLSGPLDDISLSLSSPNRADLTQGDLASLMLTGRTTSAAVAAGGAIVAEELAATFVQALDRSLGGVVLIDLSRDEDVIVGDTDPSQRFNVGVPVGQRLLVIYSQALDRSAPRWIVELRPGGELRVRFISDSDDSKAIQVGHRVSFNLWSERGIVRAVNERNVRVGRILLEGVAPEEEAGLRRALTLEAGAEFDYVRGEASARALRETLRRQGYAAADVEFRDREAGPEQVDVIFEVQRGPRFDIEWRGDDPGGAARRRVEEGWDSVLPIEETAARLAAEVRWALRADRHYTATVTAAADTTRADQGVHVIFDVRRGLRGRRVHLDFEGNEALSAETLRAALPPTNTAAFFRLLEADEHTRLESALRLAYAHDGFLEAVAGTPGQAFDAETGVLEVTIPVDEGTRAHVVALDLPEHARAPGDGPPPDLQLAVDQPFSFNAYIDDRARLTSWYREQGFTTARVTGVLEPVEGGLAVRFGVDPGPRSRVGTIRVAREGHTRPSVVHGAVTLAPGDLVRPSELARSRQHLSETGVFRSVDIRPESSGPGTQDLVIDVVPRDDFTLEYNLRYTTQGSGGVGDAPSSATSDEIQIGATLEASNPFGFGHRYRFYGLVGGERALLGLTFDAASFFGRRWRTQVFLVDDQDRLAQIPRLLGRVRGVTFQQTKRQQRARGEFQRQDGLRMQWGYTYKHVHYSDPTTRQVLAGDRAGLIHSLIGDTRDSLTDPHRGVLWSVGTELALRALGSEVDYVKVFGQLYYFVPLGAHVVWAQGYRLGITPGGNPLLLLEGRFQAGGASSVRGFDENTLGPKTAQDEPLGGQAVAIFNQELRFPIFRRLRGGLFYDAGNAFALASDLRLDSLRPSVGGGLRLMLPFGPIRLEHAWVLDPRDDEDRSRWVFSLGHAF